MVVIIGVLAGIDLPQYHKAVGKAELSQVISAMKVIQNAVERYYLVQGIYTTSISNLDIVLPNNKVKCGVGDRWLHCYNDNYLLIHYNAEDISGNNTECYAKNKNLVSACEGFLNKTAQLNYNTYWCNLIGAEEPCWAVWGVKMPM